MKKREHICIEREGKYELSEDAIVVGERMRKSEEENGGRRVRREGAFEDVVKNESGACVNTVLHKHEATTQRPWLRVVINVKPQRFVQKIMSEGAL
ncbi:hypothetical protein VIGAN_04197400, partial [Vigna angularis var. angularis]